VQIEAHDTIVDLGNYQVLIPRAASCDWISDGAIDSTWVIGTQFHGCGTTTYEVTILASLGIYRNEHDKEISDKYRKGLQSIYKEYFPQHEAVREGQIADKRWELRKRATSEYDSVYDYHVIFDEKKYYLDLWYEISERYYEEFEDSGEMGRIANTAQIWPTAEK